MTPKRSPGIGWQPQNNPGQCNLGWAYAEGRGVEKDYREAAKWYLKAAKQNDAAAQSNLGELYEDGQGVAQDYRLAMDYYKRSAEQGNALAKRNIGDLYFHGFRRRSERRRSVPMVPTRRRRRRREGSVRAGMDVFKRSRAEGCAEGVEADSTGRQARICQSGRANWLALPRARLCGRMTTPLSGFDVRRRRETSSVLNWVVRRRPRSERDDVAAFKRWVAAAAEQGDARAEVRKVGVTAKA